MCMSKIRILIFLNIFAAFMNIFSGIFPGVTTDGGGDSGGKMARADQETGKLL